jgi:hypothetical protein
MERGLCGLAGAVRILRDRFLFEYGALAHAIAGIAYILEGKMSCVQSEGWKKSAKSEN